MKSKEKRDISRSKASKEKRDVSRSKASKEKRLLVMESRMFWFSNHSPYRV
jgi:hypothetical protein